MAKHSIVAGRYANALYDLAKQAGKVDQVVADLDAMCGAIGQNQDLNQLMSSPVVSRAAQVQAIVAIGEKMKAQDVTIRFLSLLAQKRRLFLLSDVREQFQQLLAVARNEMKVHLTSCVPLQDSHKMALFQTIEKAYGQKPVFVETIDTSLIGGAVVRIGSQMFDGSLRGKLNRLQQTMKGVA